MQKVKYIQPFFGKTFHGPWTIIRYRLSEVQCDRHQYIYDTGIIAEATLLLPYSGVNIDDIVKDIITASNLSPSATYAE